jgi:hypothetical protein
MPRLGRMLGRIALAGLVLALAVAGFFIYQIGPRNLWGMLRYDQRQEGSLEIGDPAPDATLLALDGETPVRLYERTGLGRPSVIIFGSFT